MVTLFAILDIHCEFMVNLLMFIYCEVTLLFAITNRMLNKIFFRLLLRDRGTTGG